ncbi:hypothetical protein QBC44DRAFT_332529 [Cladorrhinum sp. PSN332]|nr:hypothetical protein QBC44DRAFT_332529 [Cladorrhinum sp. PSN332]
MSNTRGYLVQIVCRDLTDGVAPKNRKDMWAKHWGIRVSKTAHPNTATQGSTDLAQWTYYGLTTTKRTDVQTQKQIEVCTLDVEPWIGKGKVADPPLPGFDSYATGGTGMEGIEIARIANGLLQREFNSTNYATTYNIFYNSCQHFAFLLFNSVCNRWVNSSSTQCVIKSFRNAWKVNGQLQAAAKKDGAEGVIAWGVFVQEVQDRKKTWAFTLSTATEPVVNKKMA